MNLLPDHINSFSNQNTDIFPSLPKASYIPFLFITSKPVLFPFSSTAPYLKSFHPSTLRFWNFLPFSPHFPSCDYRFSQFFLGLLLFCSGCNYAVSVTVWSVAPSEYTAGITNTSDVLISHRRDVS